MRIITGEPRERRGKTKGHNFKECLFLGSPRMNQRRSRMLRAEKKSGHYSVSELEEDFQKERHCKRYQKL